MVGTLIVDDNTKYRQFLVELLCQHFPVMRIAEAGDGDEVWRQVQRDRPDVIFMDIHLPGRNGLELTRTIKDSHPEIVVVILTSYDVPEYQEAARENGASFFLAKSRTSEAEILALVRSLLLAHPDQ
jgi:DNA-binding NarL/FixJ family response regulator